MVKSWGVVVSALVLGLGACGGSVPSASSGAVTITTTPTTLPPDADLRARTITAVPTGLPVTPEQAGVTGAIGLDVAQISDGQPGARQSLLDNGFILGYQRLWQQGDTQVVVYLYRFATGTGADAYRQRLIANARIATPGLYLQMFDVPDLMGAQGVSLRSEAGAAVYAIVLARGTYVARVEAIGPGASQALVLATAKRQYQRL